MREEDIISGCIRRDRKCQRAFVDAYTPYILGVCRRYIKDTGLVKDCLQESLIKILNKMDKYQHKGKFKSWVAKVTVNECLMFIRKNKKHNYAEIMDSHSPIINENSSLELEIEDVLTFLDSLPDNYRIALNMYLVEGYSHKEISVFLEITESSSRSLVTRGRQKLNARFKSEEVRIVQLKKK